VSQAAESASRLGAMARRVVMIVLALVVLALPQMPAHATVTASTDYSVTPCDSSAYVYDGAANSAHLHTGEEVFVVASSVTDKALAAPTCTELPCVVSGFSVAADSALPAAGRVPQTVSQAAEWLGPEARVITNNAGDRIFLSQDGLRRIRVDINRPYSHSSPHVHVEELINGQWAKSGPIYPSDVQAR
jgi:hypothetical protein